MEMVAALLRREGRVKMKTKVEVRYSTLFWLFLFGSVEGFVLEGLWNNLRLGYWESHTATVWGPFCIIYGIGAVVIYLLSFLLQERGSVAQFLLFTLAGGAVEYFGSLFQELALGSVSWHYDHHALNIGGRVSLQMALLWGVLGILFVKAVFPFLRKLLDKMKGRGWQVACGVLTVFMVINLVVTSAAITRWRTRDEAPQPSNAAIQWLDEHYDDQTMERIFPNMEFTH